MGSSPTLVILLTILYKVLLPFFEHLHMVSPTIINAIEHTTYRQDGRVVLGADLRRRSLYWRGFESQSCHFVEITIKSLVSLIFEHLHMACSTIIHRIDH